jgi:uncharacterized membrane protein
MPGMAGLRWPKQIRKGMAILGLVIAPIGIHVAMATQRGMLWAGALVVLEAGLIAWIALSFLTAKPLRLAGCAMVLALTAAVWTFSPNGVIASSAIPHAIAYLSVLTVFGASLLPGRKPIVTTLAEKSRGPLPPEVIRYTRRVTWAWCLFCASQLLLSLLLLLFAPAETWSVFVNVLNWPLLAAMVCVEFAWRTWRHGNATRERLIDGLRLPGRLKVTTDP